MTRNFNEDKIHEDSEFTLITPYFSKSSNGSYKALVKCNCGKESEVSQANLISGKSKRCTTCGSRVSATIHGGKGTKLYSIWKGIRNRCNNKNHGDYKYYGAKGVTMCDEWDDFASFRDWSYDNGYRHGLQLDKDIICERDMISPKVYSPSTCLWVTASENRYEAINRKKAEMKENELLLISYMAGGDAMKKHFESRKCSNCKHGNIYDGDVYGCTPMYDATGGMEVFLHKDFCCNKWENKSV